MSQLSQSFEVVVIGDVQVLRFGKQRLYDSDKIESVSKALLDLAVQSPRSKFVLNLGGIDYLSSAAVGAMIRFAKRLKEQKSQLRLSDLQPMVEEIMILQRLHLVFDIIDTEANALQSFD